MAKVTLAKGHAAAPILLFIALVWLCWNAASIFWQLMAPVKPVFVTISQSNMVTAQPLNFAASNLFGDKNAPVDAPSDAVGSLKLEGVFESAAGNSAALINVNGRSREYNIGATLEGTQFALADVAWDYVVLKNSGGTLSRLRFGKTSAESMQELGAGTQAINSPQLSQTANTVQMNTSNVIQKSQQADRMLDEAAQRLRTNPVQYLTEMGVRQSSKGYEVTAAAPQQLARQIGLRPGDVIVSVNGVAVGQVQKDLALIDQLKMQRSAQVTVQRGQQTLTIQQNF